MKAASRGNAYIGIDAIQIIGQVIPEPEMNVQGNNLSIPDGNATPSIANHTDFAGTAVSGGTVSRTFTIQNTGTASLSLSGSPRVAVSGTNAADFTVTAQPASPVAAGGSTTFTVTFDPSAPGTRTATLSITNNDSDENPYNFSIQGTGMNAMGPGTYDDTHSAWNYHGSWYTYAGAGPYNNSMHYTSTPNDYAEFTFAGSEFTLIFSKYSNFGSHDVYVNGVYLDTIVATDPVLAWQSTWTSPDLGDGTYTVRFQHAGSSASFIDIDAIRVIDEDNYEQNDTLATAYDLSSQEGVWLSNINGYGAQADDDWYKIYVTSGTERVIIDVLFTHSQGDIDVDLYDASGNFLAYSPSASDNEHIVYTVPTGGAYYYILVYYGNQGNQYDLRWDDVTPPSEDQYEENDTLGAAYNLSYYEQVWLSDFNGYGIQADDDWYQIDVTPGYQRVIIYADFTHSQGDIDIYLVNASGYFLAGSYSVTDDEYIDYTVPTSGTYYILVEYGNQGNQYDLWWDDIQP